MTWLYLAVEDRLSEAVGRRLIGECLGADIDVTVLSRGGYGYLRSRIRNFVHMARRNVVVLLTDLDSAQCAPTLVAQWLNGSISPARLVFRVAVREVEAWIMADRLGFARFLGISEALVRADVEALPDPKAELLRLARRSRRALRDDLLPKRGAHSPQGLGYNDVLISFVESSWDRGRAMANSGSLTRACERIAAQRQAIRNG